MGVDQLRCLYLCCRHMNSGETKPAPEHGGPAATETGKNGYIPNLFYFLTWHCNDMQVRDFVRLRIRLHSPHSSQTFLESQWKARKHRAAPVPQRRVQLGRAHALLFVLLGLIWMMLRQSLFFLYPYSGNMVCYSPLIIPLAGKAVTWSGQKFCRAMYVAAFQSSPARVCLCAAGLLARHNMS